MPNIRPSSDLRNKYNEISEFCHKYSEPVYITKNGQGDLAVMSIETYEEMLDCIATDKAIADAEQEIAAGGQLLDAKEALDAFKRSSKPKRTGKPNAVEVEDVTEMSETIDMAEDENQADW